MRQSRIYPGLFTVAVLMAAPPASAEYYSYLVTLDSSAIQGRSANFAFWIGVYNDYLSYPPGAYLWPFPYDDELAISDLRTNSVGLSGSPAFGQMTGALPERLLLSAYQQAVAGYDLHIGQLGTTMSFLLTFSGTQYEGFRPVSWTGFYLVSGILELDNGSGFGTDIDIFREQGDLVLVANPKYTITPLEQLLLTHNTTTWSGATGSFSNAAQWSHGVPNSTLDAVIPSGSVKSVGASFVKELSVGSGATFHLNRMYLQLAGTELQNDGLIRFGGNIRFIGDGAISGTGAIDVRDLLAANETLAIGQGQDVTIDGVNGGVSGRQLINDGTLRSRDAGESNLLFTNQLINNGTISGENVYLRLRTPHLVNNGLIRADEFCVIQLNPVANDYAGPMHVTGGGSWEIGGSGVSIFNPVEFAVTGEVVVRGSIIALSNEAVGTSLSMSNLTGDGYLTSPIAVPLTILDGNPERPFDGDIHGGFALTKEGSGTQVLNGNLYLEGATTVNSGTLILNGNSTGPGQMDVHNGGTLGGDGYLSPVVMINSGGVLAPGHNGTGSLEVAVILDLQPGSTLDVDLTDDAASDLISLGNGRFDATDVRLRVRDAGVSVGTTYWFLNWGGSLQSRNPITASEFSIVESEMDGFVVVDPQTYWVGFTVTGVRAPADIDRDGDIDALDYELLAACLAGPGVTDMPAGCPALLFQRIDLDGDADVDLPDFAIFQAAY